MQGFKVASGVPPLNALPGGLGSRLRSLSLRERVGVRVVNRRKRREQRISLRFLRDLRFVSPSRPSGRVARLPRAAAWRATPPSGHPLKPLYRKQSRQDKISHVISRASLPAVRRLTVNEVVRCSAGIGGRMVPTLRRHACLKSGHNSSPDEEPTDSLKASVYEHDGDPERDSHRQDRKRVNDE
jgi:hypothetical protein